MKEYTLFRDGLLTHEIEKYVLGMGIVFQPVEIRMTGPGIESNNGFKVEVAFIDEEQATVLKLKYPNIYLAADIKKWAIE